MFWVGACVRACVLACKGARVCTCVRGRARASSCVRVSSCVKTCFGCSPSHARVTVDYPGTSMRRDFVDGGCDEFYQWTANVATTAAGEVHQPTAVLFRKLSTADVVIDLNGLSHVRLRRGRSPRRHRGLRRHCRWAPPPPPLPPTSSSGVGVGAVACWSGCALRCSAVLDSSHVWCCCLLYTSPSPRDRG